jgi:hypothetical protein
MMKASFSWWETDMNYSMITADRATHLKIIVVAFFWASVAMGLAMSIH